MVTQHEVAFLDLPITLRVKARVLTVTYKALWDLSPQTYDFISHLFSTHSSPPHWSPCCSWTTSGPLHLLFPLPLKCLQGSILSSKSLFKQRCLRAAFPAHPTSSATPLFPGAPPLPLRFACLCRGHNQDTVRIILDLSVHFLSPQPGYSSITQGSYLFYLLYPRHPQILVGVEAMIAYLETCKEIKVPTFKTYFKFNQRAHSLK